MKAPDGTLLKMSEHHGKWPVSYISNVINRHAPISKKQAFIFERVTRSALGLEIPAQVWMFGTPDEIKKLLSAWAPESVSDSSRDAGS